MLLQYLKRMSRGTNKMPKFTKTDPDDDDHEHKPAQDEVRSVNTDLPPAPPPPIRAANNPPTNTPSIPVSTFGSPPMPSFGGSNQQQMNPAVGLAQAEIDSEVTKHQIAKQDEHWAKSYWRPAMGWLYMMMCAFDFILFPLITILLPIFESAIGVSMPYNEWKSLTLSNGGMIHLAFGAILGVAAYTRGQEKIAGKQ
jgi:hypothetical protein